MTKSTSIKSRSFYIRPLFLFTFLIFTVFVTETAQAQVFTKQLKPFEKVIISPHISVIFEKGDTETVIVEDIDVSKEKLIIEEKNGTLHIYLEGAKSYTKNETEQGNGYKVKKPIYTGTEVYARIIYKKIDDLSLRGEERFVFKDAFRQNKLKLKVYGESNIRFENVSVQQLNTTLYGESKVKLKAGKIDKMKVTAYGEAEVNALSVKINELKVTAYGEASVKAQVDILLKVTAYGEAEIRYKGSPRIEKGLVIGDATIEKIY